MKTPTASKPRGRFGTRAATPPRFITRLAYLLEHAIQDPLTRFASKVRWDETDRKSVRPLAPGDLAVTWVGHATVAVQIAGKVVLTDPVWSHGLLGGLHRIEPPGLPAGQLLVADAVVISHNHYDHLDWPTLRLLPRDTPVFVPLGLADWFQRRGFSRVTELDWWQPAQLDGLTVRCVPAHHWSRRKLADTNETLWCGWILEDSAGRAAYFAGDTAYGDCFTEIGRRHPGIEVALIPIGAYAPRWYNGWAHLDPAQAVQAFEDLGANHFVPIHYDTFRLSHERVGTPRRLLDNAWRRRRLTQTQMMALAPGETQLVERVHRIPRAARIATPVLVA